MRNKAVVNKKTPDIQKSDTEPVSPQIQGKNPPAEEDSRLMLVLEEDAETETADLERQMEELLASISESKLKLEKLVEAVLDEYAKVQALDQRIQRQQVDLSRTPAKRPSKKLRPALNETVKSAEIFPEERLKDNLKQEMECLQTIQHLLKSMNSLPEMLAVASGPLPREISAGPVDGKKTILIVEDDPVSRKLLNHFLEKENYKVLNAVSAEDGFQSISQEKPDLILLDIMLPGVDGFQFLSRLKESEPGPPPPVFVISSLAQESDIVKALQAGAMDYILKPFSPQVILVKISQLFRSGR
jgi:CheY-like chemotaxis protein